MATKLIRTCDRLGCAIDAAPFEPGEDLPTYATVGYTVLKTVTDENGKTKTETLADFDEVCGSCSEQIEDLVLRITGEKKAGRPRKKEDEEPVEAAKTAKNEPPVVVAEPAKKNGKQAVVAAPTGKKRGRPSKADLAARAAAAAAAAAEASEDEEEDAEILDVNDVLRDSVKSAISKGVEVLSTKGVSADPDPEGDLDTFETESGEIVNAATGRVIARPVEGEDEDEVSDEDPSGASNGLVDAHPF